MKNPHAQEMVKRRNKKYGRKWLSENARKAGIESQKKRREAKEAVDNPVK
jgi:hypothetical protein